MARQWVAKSAEPTRRWQVGDVAITKVPEMLLQAGLDDGDQEGEGFLPHATRSTLLEVDWLRPDFITDAGEIKLSFHALVIDTGRRRILVDTCVGNDKQRPDQPFWQQLRLPFLKALSRAGYPRETVDTVICTHLHVDHVGWNTMLVDGHWQPSFPNARYLIGAQEYEACMARYAAGKSGSAFMPKGVLADSVQPIFEAGLADLVATDHVACEEVELLFTPGHTPGHVSVLISSGNERALITGDTIHHPIQLVHPAWSLRADDDPDRAIATRRALLERLAGSGILVIGSHWSGRSAGHIAAENGAYRLEQGARSAPADASCAI